MIDLHLSAFAPRWRFLYVVRIDAYIPTIVLHPEQKMIHQLCIFIIVTESAITSEQEPLVDPHKTDR